MSGYLYFGYRDQEEEAKAEISKKSGPKYLEAISQYLNPRVGATGQFDRLLKESRLSNVASIGQALSELCSLDLRTVTNRKNARCFSRYQVATTSILIQEGSSKGMFNRSSVKCRTTDSKSFEIRMDSSCWMHPRSSSGMLISS